MTPRCPELLAAMTTDPSSSHGLLWRKIVAADRRRVKAGIGCFVMLAIGTLPTLFSDPLQYLTGLFYCLLFSLIIAWLIF
ncbi:MAG: hypothetical protein ACOY32_03660 [Thermodesulfobacteriota bacterium]